LFLCRRGVLKKQAPEGVGGVHENCAVVAAAGWSCC
jgi:hypothetical protein